MRLLTRTICLAVALTLVLLFVPRAASAQLAIPQPCVEDTLPSGALSSICVPIGWNGHLIVFAHGYVAPVLPLGFYNTSLSDGTSLPTIAQLLGFAFATTSYRRNGLAILEGVDDVKELVAEFNSTHTAPVRTYIIGVSEGGLVATLLAEQEPEMFYSGLALCSPNGSFRGQIHYFANF